MKIKNGLWGKILPAVFLMQLAVSFSAIAVENPLGPPRERPPGTPPLAEQNYMGEDEREQIFQSLKTGDIIFTAKIENIVPVSVGTVASIPIIRIMFKEMEPLFGEKPQVASIPYLKPPDTLRVGKGMQVLVVLQKGRGGADSYQLLTITHTRRLNMSVILETISARVQEIQKPRIELPFSWDLAKKVFCTWVFYYFDYNLNF